MCLQCNARVSVGFSLALKLRDSRYRLATFCKSSARMPLPLSLSLHCQESAPTATSMRVAPASRLFSTSSIMQAGKLDIMNEERIWVAVEAGKARIAVMAATWLAWSR